MIWNCVGQLRGGGGGTFLNNYSAIRPWDAEIKSFQRQSPSRDATCNGPLFWPQRLRMRGILLRHQSTFFRLKTAQLGKKCVSKSATSQMLTSGGGGRGRGRGGYCKQIQRILQSCAAPVTTAAKTGLVKIEAQNTQEVILRSSMKPVAPLPEWFPAKTPRGVSWYRPASPKH